MSSDGPQMTTPLNTLEPWSLPKAQDAWVMACWTGLMDGAGLEHMAYAKGAIDALHHVGLFTDDQAELWHRRIQTCPENTPADPGHYGGRGWCAYCGDISNDL